MQLSKICLSVGVAMALAHVAQASDASKPVATVNGVRIGGEVMELLVANNVAQGKQDTPQLRALLKNELVAREVLAQEARKQKIDQEGTVRTQLLLQQNALLAEALLNRHLATLAVSDDRLRAEYKRQVDLLADAEEFQISHIVTATEAEARAVIKSARDGVPFDKLAQEKSTHASRQNGGSLGWLLANQIVPALANVVVNLQPGSVTSLPIATPEGWQVLRLDAKRKFKVPSFEDSRPQLRAALVGNERTDYIKNLLKAAKVQD